MARFLSPETLSPELLALGDYVGKVNPLRRRSFLEEDKRWTHMSILARSTMRLAAYAGALTNLAVQADDLRVSPEDRQLLDALLMSISEQLWKQSTRAALYTTRRRRNLALEALGFSARQRVQLTADMPCEGPFLFSGQFAPRIRDDRPAAPAAGAAVTGVETDSEDQPARPPGAAAAFDSLPRALQAPPAGVGGRLQAFQPAWAAITDDAFVLSVVGGGFSIELATPLPGGVIRLSPPRLPPLRHRGMAAEIAALLAKGAVERIRDHLRLSLSPTFLVPKRSGSFRLILNLKRINRHIRTEHFRMETLASILPCLRPGDWTVSIDLKDAYLHVPIAPASRDLLGFSFEGNVFRFRALPFGLKPAPRLFTRLVACVAAFLRQQGLRIFCYLDDWLLAASSQTLLSHQLSFLLRTVQSLGFLINWEKSELVPTQRPTFLGAVIDIPRQLARPSPARVSTIISAARRFRRQRRVPARSFLQFLGYLASLVDVLPDCRLHMRPLQIHLLSHFHPSRDPLTKMVPLPPATRLLFRRWCCPEFLSRGSPLQPPHPSLTVTTDASHKGWGGHCQGLHAYGDWCLSATLPHINVLEFQAVILSLHHFLPLLQNQTVLIRTDNVTVAAYINKQGGTHSPRLNALAATLWRWCRRRGIFPMASYIPGRDNLIADFLSRGRVLPSEWRLDPHIMSRLVNQMPPLEVDLFASELNAQLPRYCTRVQDPAAWRLDAFSFQWKGFRGYAFPPFPLIPRVLRKIRRDQATILLIAPWWPRRSWFLELTNLLVGSPRLLPARPELIAQPVSGALHPRPSSLHLIAWPLSGNPVLRRACQNELLHSLPAAGENPPGRLTIPVWLDTIPGANLTGGLTISTIRGYRSAIAAVHTGFEDGSTISTAPALSGLLRAFFLERPPTRRLLPSWSLPRVLEALARSPFEPLAEASLRDLTIKTVFLLAIASGQRRSALHALSTLQGHIRWERAGVRLIPSPSYVAKNQTAASSPVEIFIQPLAAHSSVAEDKVWCPVRALKYYCARTKDRRSGDQLFVVTKEPFSAASKDTISKWIVAAIKAAGSEALSPGVAPRAHDTRGISASWALFAGVSVEEIQRAAYWRSPNSFISFYLRDVPAAVPSFSRAALLSAAKSR
ncbi:uncharacterized protein [Diadema antillarum]|uniref:uncharacterized protein n=1 Tax=Diadema antillarum TaxID=105358 RepID=UPI003A8649E4